MVRENLEPQKVMLLCQHNSEKLQNLEKITHIWKQIDREKQTSHINQSGRTNVVREI